MFCDWADTFLESTTSQTSKQTRRKCGTMGGGTQRWMTSSWCRSVRSQRWVGAYVELRSHTLSSLPTCPAQLTGTQLEYGNIKGMILLSECLCGCIRSIQKGAHQGWVESCHPHPPCQQGERCTALPRPLHFPFLHTTPINDCFVGGSKNLQNCVNGGGAVPSASAPCYCTSGDVAYVGQSHCAKFVTF